MSEAHQADSPQASSAVAKQDSSRPGTEHRLDPQHAAASSPRRSGAVDLPGQIAENEPAYQLDAVGVSQEAVAGVEKTSGGVVREVSQERLLLQASQIAEHLSKQYAELDRREQRLNGQLASLDQERRNVRLWISQFEEDSEDRDARLQQQEADCTERLAQCAILEQELKTIEQTLSRDKGELEAQHETQQLEFQREQALLNNRIHFQEEHLKKSRHEFEQTQEESRREQQSNLQNRQQWAADFSRRREQAERFRDFLDQQEKSLNRERELVNKIRRANQDQNKADRERLLTEMQGWEKERELQQSELKRQQNMLKLHAENLEARRLRLDRLRAELEDTHRKTLEMRLSVEEAWAQLAQSTGPDVAKQRVDEAQNALAEHYKQSRENITQHRQELERAQVQYQKQRDDFREERQSLAEWVTERTEQLQSRELQVREQQESLETREQVWRDTRERWNHEKAQAESVIRDLLRQLAEKTGSETPGETQILESTDFGVDEMAT